MNRRSRTQQLLPCQRKARRATALLVSLASCTDSRPGKHNMLNYSSHSDRGISKWKSPESFSLPNFWWKIKSFKNQANQPVFPPDSWLRWGKTSETEMVFTRLAYICILKERTPLPSHLFVSYQDKYCFCALSSFSLGKKIENRSHRIQPDGSWEAGCNQVTRILATGLIGRI